MATQLKHSDFAYTPPRSIVRVAFQSSPVLPAVTSAVAALPAAIREATLDDLATSSTSSLAMWHRRQADLRAALMAAKETSSADETAFSRAWSAVADAQIALLITPAPTLRELGEKVSLFFEVAAHEFDEPAIAASIGADVARLLPKQAVVNDPAWSTATEALEDVKSRLAKRGLTDDAVDALTNEETAATEVLLALPSRNAADVIAKVRALSGLNTMVAVADLEPLMVELEAFTVGQPLTVDAGWARAYDRYCTTSAAYQRLAADGEYSDAASDAWSICAHALAALIATPAPTADALAVKIEAFHENRWWENTGASEYVAAFARDARRLATGVGRADLDAPLLAALTEYRAALRALKALPADATEEQEAPVWDQMDPAVMVVKEGRAQSLAGVMVKLLLVLAHKEQDAWIDDTLLAPNSPTFRDGLYLSDLYTQMMWSAIEDLSRISGVSFKERAA